MGQSQSLRNRRGGTVPIFPTSLRALLRHCDPTPSKLGVGKAISELEIASLAGRQSQKAKERLQQELSQIAEALSIYE